MHTQEPMSGQTLLLENENDEVMRDEIVKYSRKKFARKREEVSEQKSSSGNVPRKDTKTNKQTKKKSQVIAEPMIDKV